MKATAVLITKEKVYPQKILDSLQGFDEILIKTECPCIFERYQLALQAKNDLIYVQDDDCIIDWKELYKHYDGRVTNALTQHHKDYYQNTNITLIGWGTFFPKSAIDFTKYLEKCEFDEVFLREADRVFTYLNKPCNSIVMDIKHLPTATEPGRMSTSAEHWSSLHEIQRRLLLIK